MRRPKPLTFAPSHQVHWDLRAAANFIGGGSGAGLLVLLAAAAPGDPVALRSALGLGLGLVAAGLASVWLEIGRPWRALHVLFHPQTSWMTREAVVAPILFLAGAAAVIRGGVFLWPVAAAAAVFLYCQARILRAARGIPAWRQPGIVPLIAATGLVEGAGLLLLLRLMLEPEAGARLPAAGLLALLVLRALAWQAYRHQLRRAGAPAATLALYRGFGPWFLVLGHAVPVAALALGLANGTRWPLPLAAAASTLAGWWLKQVLVTRAAYTQGFALPVAPVRGAGQPRPGARPGWQEGWNKRGT